MKSPDTSGLFLLCLYTRIMKLLFIRHGQTEPNRQGRMQGQEVNEPLNETGIAQVEDAVQHLPQSIDVILSSPLKRAFQSAEIINKKFNKKLKRETI